MWLFPAEIKRRNPMTCTKCQHQTCKKFGYFGKRRIQRWRCTSCNSTFCEPHARLTRAIMTSRPDAGLRAIQCLLEGCSIRSTERLTGLNRNTIMRLLVDAGERCETLLDSTMRNLRCKRVQCDEIWTFVTKKAKHVRKDDPTEFGDQVGLCCAGRGQQTHSHVLHWQAQQHEYSAFHPRSAHTYGGQGATDNRCLHLLPEGS